MYPSELDSFIVKLKNLWKSGYDAHLNVETHAGEAWVNLHARLGLAPFPWPLQPQNQRNQNSPSRQRCRARRASARHGKAEETEEVAQKEAEELTQEETEKVDTESREIPVNLVVDESTKIDAEEAGSTEVKDKVDKDTEIETAESPAVEERDTENEKVDKKIEPVEITQKDSDAVQVHSDKVTKESAVTEVVDELCTDTEYDAKPLEVVVHATAVLENSPHEVIVQEDLDSLEKILFGAKHLTENISKLEAGQRTCRKMRTGVNRHTLELRIVVKTAKLWENPRSYIWRNLGQDLWTKKNGTELKLTRIHVKP